MNIVVLTGRLTDDPKLTSLQTSERANFSIAVQRNDKDKTVDYINCVAWGATSQYIGKYAHKGSLIEINGSLNVNKYESKNGDGSTSQKIAYIVSIKDCKLHQTALSTPTNETSTTSKTTKKKEASQNDVPIDDGDLPF